MSPQTTLYKEAKRVLEKNTTSKGIVAGSTHFKDVWARDALFASWGAIAQGLLQGPKNTLYTLKEHISSDGQIPLRVGKKSMILAFLHLPTRQGAIFGNDKTNDPALDPNSLYLITLEKYLRASDDDSLLDKQVIKRVADWLLGWQRDDGLLVEGRYASWDDSLKKQAPSIYNNALAYAALRAAARLTREPRYNVRAEQLKKAVNNTLYTGRYYRAWEGIDVFDTPGNLLAIHLGVADKSRENKILHVLDAHKDAGQHEVLPRTNYPRYPRSSVYKPFFFLGMADYHNKGPYWSWVAALEALVRREKTRQYHQLLEEWLSHGIYELYDAPRKPTNRLFYRSEKDFSWTAGLILAAKK